MTAILGGMTPDPILIKRNLGLPERRRSMVSTLNASGGVRAIGAGLKWDATPVLMAPQSLLTYLGVPWGIASPTDCQCTI